MGYVCHVITILGRKNILGGIKVFAVKMADIGTFLAARLDVSFVEEGFSEGDNGWKAISHES